MTATELWMALTAQGHEVTLESCQRLASYGGTVWVSTKAGVYTLHHSDIPGVEDAFYGEQFWLIKGGVVQQVEPKLFKRGWAAMRRLGEV